MERSFMTSAVGETGGGTGIWLLADIGPAAKVRRNSQTQGSLRMDMDIIPT